MILKSSNLLSVLGLSLALASSASAITFNFTSGNSGLSSSKTYTVDGLTVTVTAHSWSGSAWDNNAKVGQYNGYGLGVTNSGNGDSHTVDVHIRWLREKIEADPSAPKRITTVRGVGYRFEG